MVNYGRDLVTIIKQEYNQEELWLRLIGIDTQNPINAFRHDRSVGSVKFYYSNGWLRMYDFADSRYKGLNIFDAVMLKYNCKYGEAVRIVYSNTTKSVPCKPKSSYIDFAVKLKDWSKDAVNYWNSYGITPDTLSRFHVFNPKEVYINKGNGYYKLSLDDLSFIYHFPQTDHKKLYQPNNKDFKWLSNTTKRDIFGEINSDKVIITSSGKDCMTLRNLVPEEISIIAPQSESTLLELPDNLDIKLWYDNDSAGIRLAKEHSSVYGAEVFVQSHEKDPSDLYRADQLMLKREIDRLLNLF